MQLTPAPGNFKAGEDLDCRNLMQELIKAWTTVDRRDRYEFKLRVAKRKEGEVAPEMPAALA